jgi:hypothetical protein
MIQRCFSRLLDCYYLSNDTGCLDGLEGGDFEGIVTG